MNLFLTQLLFLIFVGLLFIGGVDVMNKRESISYINKLDSMHSKVLVAILFSIIVGIGLNTLNVCGSTFNVDTYQYATLGGKDEGVMFDNQAALCRGGAYMYQGNSAEAKMCQKLASTEKGKEMINQYNCPRGFIGMPKNEFEYSSNSDSNWNGVDCKNIDM